MQNGGFSFRDLNLAQYDTESGGSNTLKPGRYEAKISEATVKPCNGGYQFVATFKDPATGGEIKDFITVKHTNPTAERIGRERLKALATYAGHANPDNPGGVETFKGLTVGIIVEEGDEFTGQDGKTHRAAGKLRKFGAYFAPEGSAQAAQTARNGAASAPMDDEIPFAPLRVFP